MDWMDTLDGEGILFECPVCDFHVPMRMTLMVMVLISIRIIVSLGFFVDLTAVSARSSCCSRTGFLGRKEV